MPAKSRKFPLSQMEPMLPGEHRLGPLLEQAGDLIRAADRLGGMCQPGALAGLRTLLRAMNSYYSNEIEGQHTLPLEIEQAFHNDYSNDADKARRQRLAVAHMATEQSLESRWPAWGAQHIWSAQMVRDIHQDLFARLPEADRVLPGDTHVLQPGVLRTQQVSAGVHAGFSVAMGQLLQPGAARRNAGAGHGCRTPAPGVDPPLSRWQWPRGAPAHASGAGPPGPDQRPLAPAARLCPHP